MDRWYSTNLIDGILPVALLLLAGAATLTISIRDPRAAWAYEAASYAFAAGVVWRMDARRGARGGLGEIQRRSRPDRRRSTFNAVPLPIAWPIVLISLWGAAQLALGETAYRYATLDAALRFGAFGATAMVSFAVFQRARARDFLLETLAKFGLAIAVIGVVAYRTSPGKLLWIFPSPYPDTWGPFLSRNNFAQFLELVLPVALWRARSGALSPIATGAAVLAAGLASASRAGAVLLVAEVAACSWRLRHAPVRADSQADFQDDFQEKPLSPQPGKRLWKLGVVGAVLVFVFTAVAGAGELWGRLFHADPLEVRRELASSTAAMIRDRPAYGFGLGTFAAIYPAYAGFDAGATVEHAHNDWLEWASEGGIAFTAVWASLAIALVVPAVRSVWGIGVLAVFLHASVDFPFARPGISSWFFVLAGALAAMEAGRSRPAFAWRGKDARQQD